MARFFTPARERRAGPHAGPRPALFVALALAGGLACAGELTPIDASGQHRFLIPSPESPTGLVKERSPALPRPGKGHENGAPFAAAPEPDRSNHLPTHPVAGGAVQASEHELVDMPR